MPNDLTLHPLTFLLAAFMALSHCGYILLRRIRFYTLYLLTVHHAAKVRVGYTLFGLQHIEYAF